MLGKDFLQTAARMGSGARNLMGSMAGEIERTVKALLEARLKTLNLVSREEFEALKTLAEQARAKVEELEQKLQKQKGEKQGDKEKKGEEKKDEEKKGKPASPASPASPAPKKQASKKQASKD